MRNPVLWVAALAVLIIMVIEPLLIGYVLYSLRGVTFLVFLAIYESIALAAVAVLAGKYLLGSEPEPEETKEEKE